MIAIAQDHEIITERELARLEADGWRNTSPEGHGLPAEGQRVEHQTNVQKLIALHEALLQENPYSYFELARTRTTDWMAILATNVVDGHHDYRMLAKGQGMTPEEAAQSALQDYANRKA